VEIASLVHPGLDVYCWVAEQLERRDVLGVPPEGDVETKAALLGSALKLSEEVRGEGLPDRSSWAEEQDSQMRCCRRLYSNCPRWVEVTLCHTSQESGAHQEYCYPPDHTWDVALLVG
jgi:hypothetical protein